MARFLSDSWLDELELALGDVHLPAGSPPVTIAQVVRPTDAPEVMHEHRIQIDEQSARVVGRGAGDGPDADVTLIVDVDTAIDIARGETNAQQALADGRCSIRGRPERLAVAAVAMSAAQERLDALATATDYSQ